MIRYWVVSTAFLLIGVFAGYWFYFNRFTNAMPTSNADNRQPPILGVANIGLQVSNLTKSKQFYGEKLGFDLAFTTPGPHGERTSYFKVNDHLYIVLTRHLLPGDGWLIHNGLAATDVRGLRSYRADHGVHVPARVLRLSDGTLGFEMTDPNGQHVQFIQYVSSSDETEDLG